MRKKLIIGAVVAAMLIVAAIIGVNAATELNTTMVLKLDATYVSTSDMDGRATFPLSHTISEFLGDGSSANQSDLVWHDQGTITTGQTADIDLGDLTDAFGSTVIFDKVAGILIQNTTTTPTYILAVGAKGTNDFVNWVASATDIVNIGAGGTFLLTSPVDCYEVATDSADIIKLSNANAGSVVYNVIIWGIAV